MSNPDYFIEIGGHRVRIEEEGAFIQLDLGHERVHLGQVFHAGTTNSALGNGATALLTLTAGTRSPHVMWNVAAGGNSTFRIVEAGTITGGATITAYNRNRSSTATPLASVVAGGTLAGGVVLDGEYIAGGAGGLKPGGGSRADVEWIGDESKGYTFEIVNSSGGNAGISITLDWYEVSED